MNRSYGLRPIYYTKPTALKDAGLGRVPANRFLGYSSCNSRDAIIAIPKLFWALEKSITQ